MAKPRKVIKAGEDLVINSVLMTLAVSTGVSLATGDGWIPLGVKWGILAASTFGFLRHNFWRGSSSYNPQPRQMMRAMESLQRIPSNDPDFNSWLYKWKPEKDYHQEFVFYGDILLTPVLESEFRQFMRSAVRRQNNALYGGRAWRIRTVNGDFKRIKINWVLSENYFVNQHRPRYPLDLYHSIMTVLAVTRLRRCVNRSGKSDYLVGDWSADGYVQKAISRWLKYYPHPTSTKRRSFFSRFAN